MQKKRLAGAGGAVAFVMLTGLIGYLFAVINPAFSRFFMERLLTGENRELLLPFIGLVAFVTLLQIVIAAIRGIFSLRINGKTAVISSSTFMWKIMRLPAEFFSQRMAGDIQTRYAANATIASTLVNTISPLTLSAVMMVLYLVVMLRYSPLLTLIGLVSIALNLCMSRIISRRRVNITRVMMRDEGKLAAATVSGIQMIETIKSSGAEDGYFRRWGDYQASVNAQATRFTQLNQYLGIIPGFVTALANALVLVIGVWLCMQGRFTLGMMTAFQGFLAAFMSPAMQLVNAGQQLQEMRTQMERVEDVMEYPEDALFSDAPISETEDYAKLTGEVELRNVTFGYSRLDPPLIENFSLKLRPGGRVALVGASGCGKSTISKLISGLYIPWSGETLFDGKPISGIDRAVFTSSVAVVDQDIIFFDDTVANNIKMWDDAIEEFEMILACRDAQIHDDIMARPYGIMRRTVILSDDWYRTTFVPMIGVRKEDGLPVALLPKKYGGYTWLNTAGDKVSAGKETCAQLENEAICFYQPLPQRPLGIPDLMAYMKNCLNAYGYAVVVGLTLLVTLTGMMLPRLTKLLSGFVLESGNQMILWSTAVFILCILVSSQLLTASRELAMSRIQIKIALPMEAAMMARLMSLPAPFFKRFNAGNLASRSGGINKLCVLLPGGVFSLGVTALSTLLYINQLFTYEQLIARGGIFSELVERQRSDT